jgi:nitrate reductase cytochrome c-type subunit
METTDSSETLVTTYMITQCHNPQDHNPYVLNTYEPLVLTKKNDTQQNCLAIKFRGDTSLIPAQARVL